MSVHLARALREAGVDWAPVNGDRFVVEDRDLDDTVFVLSDMVIEVRETPTGPLLAFNGTTEWALDSLEADAAVWLPREDQMRELLGDRFVSLETVGGASVPAGFAVTVLVGGSPQREVDVDAEAAYARALLTVLGS